MLVAIEEPFGDGRDRRDGCGTELAARHRAQPAERGRSAGPSPADARELEERRERHLARGVGGDPRAPDRERGLDGDLELEGGEEAALAERGQIEDLARSSRELGEVALERPQIGHGASKVVGDERGAIGAGALELLPERVEVGADLLGLREGLSGVEDEAGGALALEHALGGGDLLRRHLGEDEVDASARLRRRLVHRPSPRQATPPATGSGNASSSDE